MKQKKQLQQNYFHVIVSKVRHQKKPEKKSEFSKLRSFSANELRTITINRLAEKLKDGHSIHPSCLDELLNKKMNDKGTKLTSYFNDTCFDCGNTTLYAVDVDHGNFSLEEVQALLEVPCALIHKTFSYQETDRRYRILFIANRPPKDLEEWRHIQIALTYQFMTPFEGDNIQNVHGKLDFSIGPSRLALGTTQDGVLFVEDQTFNVDELLINNHYVVEQFEDLETLWTLEKKRRDGEKIDEEEWNEKKNRTTKGCSTLTADELNETSEQKLDRLVLELLKSLETLKNTEDFPEKVNLIEFEDWVNHNIPLSKVFKRPYSFNCLMPHHKDVTPSAAYIQHEKTNHEIFVCRGCNTTRTSFHFMVELLKMKFGHSIYDAIVFIAQNLEIKITSKWQEDSIQLLRFNLITIRKMPENHPLKKKWKRAGLVSLYEEMITLALTKLPLQPFVSIKESSDPCFFASYRYIQARMKEKGLRGYGNLDKTAEKINRLVEDGVLIKINYSDLSTEARKETEKYRKTVGFYELEYRGRIDQKEIKAPHITFYAVPCLDFDMLDFIDISYNEKKRRGVRLGETTWSKLASVHNEERANEILPQAKQARKTKSNKQKTTKEKFNESERLFINEMNKHIKQLLQEKGWFTIKELKSKFNRKRFNKTVRDKYLIRFFHAGEVEANLVFNTRINNLLRSKYNIPDKIKKGSVIYFIKQQ